MLLISTHMFLWKNKKKNQYFLVELVPYLELWINPCLEFYGPISNVAPNLIQVGHTEQETFLDKISGRDGQNDGWCSPKSRGTVWGTIKMSAHLCLHQSKGDITDAWCII